MMIRTLCLVAIVVAVIQPVDVVAQDNVAAERDFTLKVLPVLKQKCLGCHGGDPEDIKGEYSVVDREHLLRGGESGDPAIVPGDIADGTLLGAIRWADLEMPPKENDRLDEQQIAAIERWIAAGAPWPSEAAQTKYRTEAQQEAVNEDGMTMTTSGGTSDDWTQRRYKPDEVWAFQPVQPLSAQRTQELAGQTAGDGQHDSNVRGAQIIDGIIDEALKAAKLPAVDRADPRVLVRRATYDLHGLPPTPAEVSAFVKASGQDRDAAWQALIERLLESPRYGERWARHWLDVTRYADTGGMSNDYERSNMWRYRDYVIRAFNEDKPYNEFIIEQIAGDELADQSVQVRNNADQQAIHQAQLDGDYTQQEAEWIVASGFLRLGPWDNAMVATEEARHIWLDDLVNITGQTFLSTTMRCVKCHDHKFDPIPTRDYYRMYAAFSTTQMAERKAPLLDVENRAGFDTGRAHVQRMLDYAVQEKDRLVNKRETAARAWFEERNLPYKTLNERQDLPDEEKPPRHVGLNYVDEGQLKIREQDEWIWNRRLERYRPLAQSVYNAPVSELAWNGARKLRIDRNYKKSEPPINHILVGGALTALGDVVGPGVLSAIAVSVDESRDDPYLLSNDVDGRRLGMARWIANPQNSLTTRSIVNRIWQYHFGTGIAVNANNFGAKGGQPSHPALLDHLAADFVQHGWKIKRLHRQIMLSQAYQRSSLPPKNDQWTVDDPNNRLLSHFPRRRMSAEEIRDSMLAVTGELQHRSGGLPIMPEINMEVALQPRMIQFSLAPAYQPSPTPTERNGRSIYAYKIRGQADPFTEIFNQPNPNESCEQRESATVTPQVFTLLNSDMTADRSIAFALRIEKEAGSLNERIDRAMQLMFGRDASAKEVESISAYVTEMVAYHESTPAAPVKYPTSITRSLVEEFSGKPFEYEEILPIFETYQADTKAADVSAETRALADFCLLLFNANEFIYVN